MIWILIVPLIALAIMAGGLALLANGAQNIMNNTATLSKMWPFIKIIGLLSFLTFAIIYFAS